jgi:DNA (cytosine-5)-methyltransferase 1
VTRVPTIDLFAGAGGLSIAARRAGCDVRLHVELDSVACDTLLSNRRHHPDSELLKADVTNLNGADLRRRIGLSRGDPLLIVGGAPCQPFSKAAFWSEDGDDAAFRRARSTGRRSQRPQRQKVRHDERRTLVDEFVRLVLETRADGFVFENVATLAAPRYRGMLNSLLRTTRAAGFFVSVLKANAVDFGVPQRRERLFVLASRVSEPIPPNPTHSFKAKRPGLQPALTAGQALSPFSDARFSEPEETVVGRWADHLREVPPGWNYKAHTAWAGHPNPSFVTETRFWNFLLKLSPDLPSWTIAANPGPWTGPFHWDSRRLRVAELAALQAFPKSYVFRGSRRERVRQIGNAAPPPLAAAMISPVVETITRRKHAGARCAA